ncbi:MAG: polysaccharide biosynthesis/export family protein [Candidatus Eisenbacteria bacterium]
MKYEPLDHRRPRVLVAVAHAVSPIAVALALLALALALGALLAPPPAEAKRIKIPVTELPREPAAAESLAYAVDDLPYRVAPGDLLSVDFGVSLDGRQLRADNVLVRPDGMITLNLIGDVRAAGLTTADLDSLLTQKYSGVFREPRITIAVTKLAGNFVHVLGEVKVPGSYEILPNATVLQAIARAGGATSQAGLGNVILLRRTGPKSLVAQKVQLNRALKQGLAIGDPYVRRFDIVYVPKSTIASINQFVEQHIEKMLSIPQGYIYGWEVFHLDRVFVKSNQAKP